MCSTKNLDATKILEQSCSREASRNLKTLRIFQNKIFHTCVSIFAFFGTNFSCMRWNKFSMNALGQIFHTCVGTNFPFIRWANCPYIYIYFCKNIAHLFEQIFHEFSIHPFFFFNENCASFGTVVHARITAIWTLKFPSKISHDMCVSD